MWDVRKQRCTETEISLAFPRRNMLMRGTCFQSEVEVASQPLIAIYGFDIAAKGHKVMRSKKKKKKNTDVLLFAICFSHH